MSYKQEHTILCLLSDLFFLCILFWRYFMLLNGFPVSFPLLILFYRTDIPRLAYSFPSWQTSELFSVWAVKEETAGQTHAAVCVQTHSCFCLVKEKFACVEYSEAEFLHPVGYACLTLYKAVRLFPTSCVCTSVQLPKGKCSSCFITLPTPGLLIC